MSATPTVPSAEMVESIDHRVVLHGVSWADYERLLAVRGESAVPRLTYLAGELELMTPSRSHESIKTLIARLVEAYADERGIDLNGFGSWTIKSAPRERGLEPDECYIVGAPGERETPDLAIEVEWTKRLVDKLEVYRGLGLAEVWVWRRGRIEVHVLAGEEYRRVGTSSLFPDLDLAVLAHHVESPSQTQAVRDFRAWLRERR